MKQTILALALVVLPGAHAVTRQNHCYRALHCYKTNTAAIAADASSSAGNNGGTAAASGPNSGDNVAAFTLGNCAGEASGTSTYIDAKGLFNAKGGLMASGSAATATAGVDCVVPLTVANAKVGTATPTTAAAAAIKVAPTILVGKTYTDSACSTELSADYPALASLYASATANGEESTAITAAPSATGATGTSTSGSQAITGDKVFAMTFSQDAAPNTSTGAIGAAVNDWVEPLGTQALQFPKLLGSDWSTGTATLTAGTTATDVCQTFSSNVATAINAKKTANWMLPLGFAKAAGAEMSAAHKAIYYSETDASDARTDAPGSVTATCKTTATASVLEVQYHKAAACGGTAPAWTPENATAAKVSCFPVRHIRHSTCKGTVACVNSAEAVLKHLNTEQAADKKCGLAADTAPGKLCSKACQCPDKAGDLNWAVTKSSSDCWASSTRAGQVKVDLALYNVGTLTAITAKNAHTEYASSTHGGLRKAAVDAVFTKYGDATSAQAGATTGVTNSVCGAADVAEEAKAGDGAAKGYLVEHSTLWTATGCGYTKPDSGGARAQYALSAIATLGALVGAALF